MARVYSIKRGQSLKIRFGPILVFCLILPLLALCSSTPGDESVALIIPAPLDAQAESQPTSIVPKVKLLTKQSKRQKKVFDALRHTLLSDTNYFYPLGENKASQSSDPLLRDVPNNTACYQDAREICPTDLRARDIGLVMTCMFSNRIRLSRACAEDLAPRLTFHCAHDIAITCHPFVEVDQIRAAGFVFGATREAREKYISTLLKCLTTNLSNLESDCAETIRMPPPALPPTYVSDEGYAVSGYVRASGTGEIVGETSQVGLPKIPDGDREAAAKAAAKAAAEAAARIIKDPGVSSVLNLIGAVNEAAKAASEAESAIDEVANHALRHSHDDVWGEIIETHDADNFDSSGNVIDSTAALGLDKEDDSIEDESVSNSTRKVSFLSLLDRKWVLERVNQRPWLPVVALLAGSLTLLVIVAAVKVINWSTICFNVCNLCKKEPDQYDPYNVPPVSSVFTQYSKSATNSYMDRLTAPAGESFEDRILTGKKSSSAKPSRFLGDGL